MAWLDPDLLTCPSCGRKEQLTWVCGVPLTPEGREKSKGYVSPHKTGGWVMSKTATDHVVTCPDCQTEVKRRSRTP